MRPCRSLLAVVGNCLTVAAVKMGWFQSYYVSVQIVLNALYICTALHARCLKVMSCHLCLVEKEAYSVICVFVENAKVSSVRTA